MDLVGGANIGFSYLVSIKLFEFAPCRLIDWPAKVEELGGLNKGAAGDTCDCSL